MISIKKIVELAHYMVGLVIKEGDYVIDATAGNGYDTLFLAEKVGPGGHVYAYDIQEEALVKTAERLKEKKLDTRVTLIQDGHEKLLHYVTEPVSAVMYNLGYLPGSNRRVTTETASTLASFEQALNLINPGGVITIVLYPGHFKGRREKEALLPVCNSLSLSDYAVLHIKLVNQANDPPELLVIQKIIIRPG